MVTGDTKIKNNKTCPQGAHSQVSLPCYFYSYQWCFRSSSYCRVIFLPPAPDCSGFLQSIHSLLRLCWLNAFPKIIDSSRNSLAGDIPPGFLVSTERLWKDSTLIIRVLCTIRPTPSTYKSPLHPKHPLVQVHCNGEAGLETHSCLFLVPSLLVSPSLSACPQSYSSSPASFHKTFQEITSHSDRALIYYGICIHHSFLR